MLTERETRRLRQLLALVERDDDDLAALTASLAKAIEVSPADVRATLGVFRALWQLDDMLAKLAGEQP